VAETYTPDTSEVREAALFWAAGRGRGTTPEDYDAARAAFDRWLTDVKRIAWFEGATSRQCHCNAYEEGECACGMYPSEPNPYSTQ
jgi:hypothetical protein